jgi:hypothetical protein
VAEGPAGVQPEEDGRCIKWRDGSFVSISEGSTLEWLGLCTRAGIGFDVLYLVLEFRGLAVVT